MTLVVSAERAYEERTSLFRENNIFRVRWNHLHQSWRRSTACNFGSQ